MPLSPCLLLFCTLFLGLGAWLSTVFHFSFLLSWFVWFNCISLGVPFKHQFRGDDSLFRSSRIKTFKNFNFNIPITTNMRMRRGEPHSTKSVVSENRRQKINFLDQDAMYKTNLRKSCCSFQMQQWMSFYRKIHSCFWLKLWQGFRHSASLANMRFGYFPLDWFAA